MRIFAGSAACAALLSALPILPPDVLPGLDVLRRDGLELLEGRRIGLLTNPTGRTVDGTPALRVLRDDLGLEVVALFSPEHGFDGSAAAGETVGSTRDADSELPVHSLYGDDRSPTRDMLSGIDVLVFDLQDVGVRFYTYASTMKLAMDAAAEAGVAFVVLDRPNPNGGLRVEGPVLEPELASFVGIAPIPLLHGMTVGELATLFRAEGRHPEASRLHVVRVEGLRRDMLWADTGLSWRAPSPNLRTAASAYAYPALGLLEGVNVSEGRGTERAFEQAGAPWLDSAALVARLTAVAPAGASFRPASFVPRSIPAAPHPKFEGESCHGFTIRIHDPRAFEPVRTGLAILAALREIAPDELEWVQRGALPWIDLLAGTDRLRLGLESGLSVEAMLERERPALERFLAKRDSYLLY